jgi:hypothetical protein
LGWFVTSFPVFAEIALEGMAGTTRLELATSAVTGQRSNRLNYVPARDYNDLRKSQCLCGFAGFAYGALSASIATVRGGYRTIRP